MTNEELLKLAYTRELTDERVRVAAGYWLDASPHEQIKADGVILARYARAAMGTIEQQREEIKRLREALEWYADESNYEFEDDEHNALDEDRGLRAKAALSHQTERASSALDAVIAERARQEAKWGQQDHEPALWLGILMEEVGELAQAINETVFDNGAAERAKGGYANMRAEAVQVAAVAVALVEALDRRYGGDEAHYLVIGKYIGEPMGCCSEEGKADVLVEEPGSSFKLVNKAECPICCSEG